MPVVVVAVVAVVVVAVLCTMSVLAAAVAVVPRSGCSGSICVLVGRDLYIGRGGGLEMEPNVTSLTTDFSEERECRQLERRYLTAGSSTTTRPACSPGPPLPVN